MKQTTMNKMIIANLNAQFTGKDVLVHCIIGTRGTGKTSGVKKLTKELGAKLLNVSIPSKDITYFTG